MAGGAGALLDSAVLAYGVLGVVQTALAATIIARQWRSEWAWIVAGLFMCNGALAVVNGLFLLGEPAYAVRVARYFDHASFFLIAYLALVFPTRPRALQRHPWLVRTAVLVPMAAVLAMHLLDAPNLINLRGSHTTLTVPRLLVGFALPAAVWSLLLARWTFLWTRGPTPLLKKPFQLVFAAFAIRAASQLLVTLPVGEHPGSPPALRAAALAFDLVPLAVLLACLTVLLRVRARQVGTPARQTTFVLAFFLAGLAEAALMHRTSDGYWSVFLHLDLFVLRPALLWFAMVRHQFLGATWRQGRAGLLLLWTLALAAYSVMLDGLLPVPSWTAPLVAAILATATLYMLRPWLVETPLGPGPQARRAETYLAAAEDAFRDGEPSPIVARRLEALRVHLDFTQEQHEALVEAVRTRWSRPAAGPWTRGQTVLGRYQVEAVLGTGTTGQTYRAHDVLHGCDVVLKRTHGLETAGRRALLREAEALAALDHPNVVRLLRTEFVGDEPVLVLEHLPGGSLQGLLERTGRLPPGRAVAVALDVLGALEAVHARGIVHRDVKPANILFDARGRAKLGDFDIAHRRGPALGDPTLPDSRPGSLRYMAPEQVQGVVVDARTDLYALAVVLHEALSGQHPVAAGRSEFATAQSVLADAPPPLPRSVPAPLRDAVAQGLRKRPERRHASAALFAQRLRLSATGTTASSARPRPRPHWTTGGAHSA